jgi:hypothetical protein
MKQFTRSRAFEPKIHFYASPAASGWRGGSVSKYAAVRHATAVAADFQKSGTGVHDSAWRRSNASARWRSNAAGSSVVAANVHGAFVCSLQTPQNRMLSGLPQTGVRRSEGGQGRFVWTQEAWSQQDTVGSRVPGRENLARGIVRSARDCPDAAAPDTDARCRCTSTLTPSAAHGTCNTLTRR